MAMSKALDTVLSQTDPGDDVQRRFRYQADQGGDAVSFFSS